jgi:hypothetical protein
MRFVKFYLKNLDGTMFHIIELLYIIIQYNSYTDAEKRIFHYPGNNWEIQESLWLNVSELF